MNLKVAFGFDSPDYCPGYCPESSRTSRCRWSYVKYMPSFIGKKTKWHDRPTVDALERGYTNKIVLFRSLSVIQIHFSQDDEDDFNLIEKACLEYADGNMTHYMNCFTPTHLIFEPSWSDNDWWWIRRDSAWKYSSIKIEITGFLRKPHPGIKEDKLVMSRTFVNPGNLWLDPYASQNGARFMVCKNAVKDYRTNYMMSVDLPPSGAECCNRNNRYTLEDVRGLLSPRQTCSKLELTWTLDLSLATWTKMTTLLYHYDSSTPINGLHKVDKNSWENGNITVRYHTYDTIERLCRSISDTQKEYLDCLLKPNTAFFRVTFNPLSTFNWRPSWKLGGVEAKVQLNHVDSDG
ncbi:hypothetical protein L596_025529 [Steinernema carpocapsae]|uniref:Uncharacterized protein n=1 Tax=Steinernema carpocapsae TaxID=34508 RepID=A0A4U5M813_STECR|nr:hypothetical protein L596_025529 [Steinernema carpocapsae]